MAVTWQFSPMDNWFFRDSKPMNAGESVWLESIFPPTGQTLQGAIRTAILDYKGIDYQAFKTDKETQKLIGNADNLGLMQISGPWIQKTDTTYYPLPLDFVKNSKINTYDFLKPSQEPLECDLGTVKMPAIQGGGYKVMENHFIDKAGMTKLLRGNSDNIDNHILPLYTDDINTEALADREPKIGLARDNKTRKAMEGMLFAIASVRPRKDISLAIHIDGLAPPHLPEKDFLQPLGGEGKLAHIKKRQDLDHPAVQPKISKNIIHFKIVLTTHALMPEQGWLPTGFTKIEGDSHDIWEGKLPIKLQDKSTDISIKITTACIGKPFKMGGWNHAKHKARPLVSYIPAGSVYFCETAIENKDKLQALHNSKIGDQTEYGFGHILLGQW